MSKRSQVSEQYGKPLPLKLGHSIFVSHSGVDKEFAADLHEGLKQNGYNPFVDLLSLPEGQIVNMKNILEEAKTSKLAVCVLSENFFARNKNPMLEVAQCVEAKVPLLPLFYHLTVEEFKDERRREVWYAEWRKWEEDQDSRDQGTDAYDPMRVDISRWKEALKVLGDTMGPPLDVHSKDPLFKVKYRKKIIQIIRNLVPNKVWDDENTQGKLRLHRFVEDMFEKVPMGSNSSLRGARVVGLYGISGLGKTELCITLQNFYYSAFEGKVCHVQLPSESMSEADKLKFMKKVLTTRSSSAEGQLIEKLDDYAIGKGMLKRCESKVFLVIDNLSDHNMNEASDYLEGQFEDGSKVLITARRKNALLNLLSRAGVQTEGRVVAMPGLEEQEAVNVFLGYQHEFGSSEEVKKVVHDYLQLCRYGEAYHPRAVAVLGAWLRSISTDPLSWRADLDILNLNLLCILAKEVVVSEMLKHYCALEKQGSFSITFHLPADYISQHNEIAQWLTLAGHGGMDDDQPEWNLLKSHEPEYHVGNMSRDEVCKCMEPVYLLITSADLAFVERLVGFETLCIHMPNSDKKESVQYSSVSSWTLTDEQIDDYLGAQSAHEGPWYHFPLVWRAMGAYSWLSKEREAQHNWQDLLKHWRLTHNRFPARTRKTLDTNQSLESGQYLTYGNYRLTMQDDCNLVLYGHANRVCWETKTTGRGRPNECRLAMQSDGNLVIYSARAAIWSTHSEGAGGSYRLRLHEDGNIVIHGPNEAIVWEPTSFVAHWREKDGVRHTLYPGDSLESGQALMLKKYRLVMQDDCNLVLLYGQSNEILWETGSRPRNVGGQHKECVLRMQRDGNLVIYNGNDGAIWSSNTVRREHAFYRLRLQADGNIAIIGPSGVIWTTKT